MSSENSTGIVIVGAGHAGVEAADALRRQGWHGAITLLDEQEDLPYQRPPLSKEGLISSDEALPLRAESHYAQAGIELRRGASVGAIDRLRREVVLSDGTRLPFGRLILATGSEPARLPFAAQDNDVRILRSLADAATLRTRLAGSQSVLIIGAGFIGLEIAGVARGMGAAVTVIGRGAQVMPRSLSAAMASVIADRHCSAGIDVRLDTEALSVASLPDGSTAVMLSDGSTIEVDTVVAGVGVAPRTRLAAEAGLHVEDGVIVSTELRTSDPHIFAIGDCAAIASASGRPMRLESVQNATDQARHVAAVITTGAGDYDEVPWFWSVQGGMRLQIAGVGGADDRCVLVGDPAGRLSVLRFAEGALVCVESVNDAASHLAARRLLASNTGLRVEDALEPDFTLRDRARTLVDR
ncbi:NAD(P)/FAD-dependent oxidoreductase [Microbacterium sp. Root61]|uniref:NAD(P)/FAD-dependent oxidoreductase n=1 Tax=Microbacterium sp. Root61 TaxID=1736570 RepID=UPI000AEFFB52|nr:FAD-dependent oxidoreductase [Microbacterium sp. Root61]